MSLPSGYKRLEYIRSSGTQYINTNLSMASGFRAEIDIEFTSLASSILSCVIGAHNDSSPYGRNFLAAQTSLFQIGMGDGYYNFGSPTTGEKYHIDFSNVYGNAYCKINGIGQTLSEAATGTNSYSVNTLYILAVHGGESWFQKVSGNTYHCKIYSTEGTLVRDYIPCQTTAGEIGLWDDVNEVFYGNAGTGTFTAGPVVGVATPENFRLSSSTETTATLAWSAVDGATGYKLYRDGTLITTLTDTSYTDTIQPFTSYIYTLTAYNDNGESDPATISVQVIIPPETPSNFRASSASVTAISLAWDAVTGADSYQLSRDGAVIYTGKYPSYTDSGLTAETAYTYTLSAVNSAGSSAETTLEAATTQFILVTDRTAADVDAGNDKGTYKASDLNRVGAAMNYVAARLREQGYDPHISPKADWTDSDWVTPADQAVYLGDLAELRKQFTMMASTPEVPPDLEKLNYIEANNIEQILVDIDALLTNIAAWWLYSGEIYSGEV